MFPKRQQLVLASAVTVLLILPSVAFAAEDIVKVKNYGNALTFVPQIEADDMILTVTGPCNYLLRRSLRNDGELFFKIDETTIDGRYRFEVTAIPQIDGSIIDVLKNARKTGDNSEVDRLCRDGELPGDPQILTAGFTVDRSKIVYYPEDQEESAGAVAALASGGLGGSLNKDFVINDDLIVDGSACIGFDCVNGESFGFDTIRLKENNLRIHFDDTSTAASFPRNDWTLLANDSANGGASKFSIEDRTNARIPFTVEANARSNSLYVDDGGRIGNRTSTPSVEIHSIDGDTPTLRLQQDASSGFAPQTWDVAGNETNFFIRDVTSGSTLPLRIRPGAPSSSIFIDVDGDVGMGTSSPDVDLHVEDTADNAEIQLETAAQSWKWRANSANNQMNVIDNTNSKTPFRIAANTDNNLLQLGTTASNRVDITGNLNITGTCTGCDAVFQPDWPLESIEEHAESMWRDSYLPAVGPTQEGETSINVFEKVTGMLQELEKAHIYIEQLHQQLSSQQDVIGDLEHRLQQIEDSK